MTRRTGNRPPVQHKPLQRAFLHIAVSPKPTSSLHQKTDDRCSRLFSHPNSNGLAFSWATLINSEVSACADVSLMVSTHDGCETSAQDFGSDFGRSRSQVRGAIPQWLAREESRIGSLFHCRLLYKMPRLIYFIYRSVLMSYVG